MNLGTHQKNLVNRDDAVNWEWHLVHSHGFGALENGKSQNAFAKLNLRTLKFDFCTTPVPRNTGWPNTQTVPV